MCLSVPCSWYVLTYRSTLLQSRVPVRLAALPDTLLSTYETNPGDLSPHPCIEHTHARLHAVGAVAYQLCVVSGVWIALALRGGGSCELCSPAGAAA